jgi:hypothetical protein
MHGKSASIDHSRRDILRFAAASAVGLALPGGHSAAFAAPGGVSGPLRSAGVLTFGPNNVLFVGDIIGAKIHAFALQDKDLTSQTDVISGNFHNFEGRDHVVGLDQKLAALFGTTIDKIVINDLAVHQPTEQIFFSVERGRGADALPAIVKVNHGQLEILQLESISHSQVSIPDEPDSGAMLEFDPQQMYAITDRDVNEIPRRFRVRDQKTRNRTTLANCRAMTCRRSNHAKRASVSGGKLDRLPRFQTNCVPSEPFGAGTRGDDRLGAGQQAAPRMIEVVKVMVVAEQYGIDSPDRGYVNSGIGSLEQRDRSGGVLLAAGVERRVG